MTDLSMREAAARALHDDGCGGCEKGFDGHSAPVQADYLRRADAVLAAVAAPDGLVEVLRVHRVWRIEWDDDQPGVPQCDACWMVVDPGADEEAHLADVVRAWTRGEL